MVITWKLDKSGRVCAGILILLPLKIPFFLLVIFIIRLQCNILHFLVNRVSEPLVGSKMAITLELKLCLSNFSRGIEKQKVIKVEILNFHASS